MSDIIKLMSKRLFFIALLPPLKIQHSANRIKHYFAEVYHSKAALKSPPHITLQPPFYWESDRFVELQTVVKEFANKQAPIPIVLDGFAVFKPRVIYIDVHKTPELLTVQKDLVQLLESSLKIVHNASKTRPFTPHMTVGFKDLTKANFYKAWKDFQYKPFDAEFTVSKLTLLQFMGQQWEIKSDFYL